MASNLRAPTCFKCNSSYKVEEVTAGIFCCRGFCRKIFNSAKETGEIELLLAQQKKALVGPNGDTPQPKISNQVNGEILPSTDRTTIPKFKIGEYCRAPFLEATRFVSTWESGGVYEAVVNHVVDSKQVIVRFVGITDDYQIAVNIKDLRPSQGKAARTSQTEQATTCGQKDVVLEVTSFKQGDYCRAVYEGHEYEAQVTANEVDEGGNAYCNIRYLGYGNEETKWLTDLKPSLGKVSRKLQRTAAASEMGSVKPADGSEISASSVSKYKIGDRCRAMYEGIEYDAEITAISSDENGTEYCTVKFLGYGNEETVWVSDLKPASSEVEERSQETEAALTQVAESFKVGDFCRASYEGMEYEAEITSIASDENGVSYCTVKFLGYGNEESAWLADLKPTLGEAAREEQKSYLAGEQDDTNQKAVTYKEGDFCRAPFEEAVYEAEVVTVTIDESGAEYCTVKYLGYGNENTVWMSDLTPSLGNDARKDQILAATPETNAAQDQNPKQRFKDGDFGRAFFEDNEYEVEILSVVMDDSGAEYCSVKLIGYESEATVWMSDLKASLGKDSRDAQLAIASGTLKTEIIPSYKTGDFCCCTFNDVEYEAEVLTVNVDDTGAEYCNVKHLGYETESTVWAADLKESKGNAAREAQIAYFKKVTFGKEVPSVTVPKAQDVSVQRETSTNIVDMKQVSECDSDHLGKATEKATVLQTTTSTISVSKSATASTPIRNGGYLPKPSDSVSTVSLPETKNEYGSEKVQDLFNRLLKELDLAEKCKQLESKLKAEQMPKCDSSTLAKDNENLRITVQSMKEGNKELLKKIQTLEEQLSKKPQSPNGVISTDEVKRLQEKIRMHGEIQKVAEENLFESQKKCLSLEDQVKEWRKKYQDKIEQASADTGMLFKKVESLEQDNAKLLKKNKALQNEIVELKLSSL